MPLHNTRKNETLGGFCKAEERIGLTFPPNGACRAVTGVYPQMIAQGKDLFSNPFDQLMMVSALKVRSSHRACEKRISCEDGAWCIEADTPRRVTGRVYDRYAVGPQADLLSVVEKFVGPVVKAGGIKAMNHERSPANPLKLTRASHVIYVTVCD